MNTQQERDRLDSDDMKGTQSDSTRSQNRQAAANADQNSDRHSNEGGEAQNAPQAGSHQEGQYSKQSDKPEVQKGGPLK
jgi:hypothetical protein